jgi:hypothetical protein
VKVFISWSGQHSWGVAKALRSCLRLALPHIDFWMSSEDMGPGVRWSWELGTHLADAQTGIICVTRENLSSPWLLFEAGAISHALGRNAVIPYLLDLSPPDLSGPLAQFQALQATEDGTRLLFQSINKVPGGARLDDVEILKAFLVWWPEISRALEVVMDTPKRGAPKRSERDLLEELVDLVRQLSRREAPETASAMAHDLPWVPADFKERALTEIFRFFEQGLLPESHSRAAKEWEHVEATNPEEKIWERALELAQRRAVSLGLGEIWVQWVAAKTRAKD